MSLEKQANRLAEESLGISGFFSPVTPVRSSFVVMEEKKHF